MPNSITSVDTLQALGRVSRSLDTTSNNARGEAITALARFADITDPTEEEIREFTAHYEQIQRWHGGALHTTDIALRAAGLVGTTRRRTRTEAIEGLRRYGNIMQPTEDDIRNFQSQVRRLNASFNGQFPRHTIVRQAAETVASERDYFHRAQARAMQQADMAQYINRSMREAVNTMPIVPQVVQMPPMPAPMEVEYVPRVTPPISNMSGTVTFRAPSTTPTPWQAVYPDELPQDTADTIDNNLLRIQLALDKKDMQLVRKETKALHKLIFADEIAIYWGVEDVIFAARGIGLEISDKMAREVLDHAGENHDATVGINWEVLENIIRNWDGDE